MLETLYANRGIGLAATQIDVHERIVVMDVSDTRDQPQVFINPEIVGKSQTQVQHREGCLSVPGVYDGVSRAEEVEISAISLDGSPFRMQARGLAAVCIQHEIDHLDGKVFVQYLSRLKQGRIRERMRKAAVSS
jgi:peptide deformylase